VDDVSNTTLVPEVYFYYFSSLRRGRGKINLWLKATIDSLSRANQLELGSMGVREGKNWGAERNFSQFRIVPALPKKFSEETFQNCCRRGGGVVTKNSY
jgi:hypothetical protein